MRSRIAALIRNNRWVPPVICIGLLALFIASSWLEAPRWTVALTGVAFAGAGFVWGYIHRALKLAFYPALNHLHRRQYADTWDALAASPKQAREAACGESDENKLRLSAQRAINNITQLARIGATDHVLEIGCGVARIGFELAPRCQHWTGVDISKNMLACAADLLSGLDNVRLVHLLEANLNSLPDSSFDLVYATKMFDHLDQLDRCRYILDAFRVLRPSGRLYVDNTDLESDAGWAAFANGVSTMHDFERPPYQPVPATEAELTTYAKRAGFVNVQGHHRSPLVIMIATKPG